MDLHVTSTSQAISVSEERVVDKSVEREEVSHTYTHEEAMIESLEYFGGDDLAASVFLSKYALRNDSGALLEKTPDQMHRRLAREFARVEAKYSNAMSEGEIYGLLKGFKKVIPQGSPMAGIGNPFQISSLSNCFVIDTHDSYGGIMKADQEEAQIMKRRGGVGLDISAIRPKGLRTSNAARTTDGIGVFMERFSNTCREVAQNGRRGALMLTISVHHPEIRTFINIKKDKKKVTGANVSIRITDEFMHAVMEDREVELRWPVEAKTPSISEHTRARDLWDEIIEAAWESAEPGLLFWSTIEKYSPADCYSDVGFKTVSTNPCSELPLSRADSCRLLLVNVFEFVIDPFKETALFDSKGFTETVIKAQRLMDDVVDLELENIDKILAKIEADPESEEVKGVERRLWQEIRAACYNGRRCGLGLTGLGDAIAALGHRYGDQESIEFTGSTYQALAVGSYKSSCLLAAERGPFPVFSHEKEEGHPFLTRIWEASPETFALYKKHGRRNIANLTTAPAGSVSTQTQTTSGIEPAYLLEYKRRRKITSGDEGLSVDFVDALGDKWHEYTVYHHNFRKWMEESNKTKVEDSPYFFATSNDVDWLQSVKLQAAAQKWVDHAISKTCNLPADATKEMVAEVYEKAWELQCKGFTVYRDGCRDGVLIKKEDPKAETSSHKRPKELPCDIHRVTVKGETYLVLIGLLDGRPYEVFCGLSEYVEVPKKAKSGVIIKNGKKDGVATYNLIIPVAEDDEIVIKDIVSVFENKTYGSFSRMLSLSLRHSIPLSFVVEQLQKDRHSDMQSFSRVIARVLKGYIADGTRFTGEKTCSACGMEGTLIYSEGCVQCLQCGFSKCS